MPDATAPTGRIAGFRDALGESPPLLWSFLYFFCLLSGYYVLRPVRDAMGASSEVEAVFPPAMIDFFAAHGIPLHELSPRAGSLEDAYLALTETAVEYKTKDAR